MNIEDKYKLLEEENSKLKLELEQTKEHLKKYTAPDRSKRFYQNHKEEIKEKVKEYVKKTNYKPVVSKESGEEFSERFGR